MKPDPAKTVNLSPTHSIEVGTSTWNPKEMSVRSRYSNSKNKFSPHGSSELPLEDILPVLKAVADSDLLPPKTLAKIVEAASQSIDRQT